MVWDTTDILKKKKVKKKTTTAMTVECRKTNQNQHQISSPTACLNLFFVT